MQKGRRARASLPGVLAFSLRLSSPLLTDHEPGTPGSQHPARETPRQWRRYCTTHLFLSVFYFLKFIEKESHHCGYLISSQAR